MHELCHRISCVCSVHVCIYIYLYIIHVTLADLEVAIIHYYYEQTETIKKQSYTDINL